MSSEIREAGPLVDVSAVYKDVTVDRRKGSDERERAEECDNRSLSTRADVSGTQQG